MNLKECGSADLDYRTTRTRPTSLRTSDRSSFLRYMGLRKLESPVRFEADNSALYLFGKDSFFQPYLPLQQVESLRAPSWLVGTTNQIVTQQRDCAYDVLVNVSFSSLVPTAEHKAVSLRSDRKCLVRLCGSQIGEDGQSDSG